MSPSIVNTFLRLYKRWFLMLVLLKVSNTKTLGGNYSLSSFVEELLNKEGYDSSARPGLDVDNITMVDVDIFINGISSINEIDMDYRVDLYVRQTWQDYRLSFLRKYDRPITLNYNVIRRIWVPDLFFRNEKHGTLHAITVPNRLLRLWPNGTILYSQRVTLILDCQMFLEKYPMDNQTCYMDIGSYGYTISEVNFRWHRFKNPVRIKDNLMLPEFEIQGAHAVGCEAEYYTGTFACLNAVVYLKRQFEFYLLQTYVPAIMVVVLSWVSFWIDIDAVPARITLGLLTVLTMTTQASSISERLPRVSYIKAIDVWMATCLFYVFCALIEYSCVNVLYRRHKSRLARLDRHIAQVVEMHDTEHGEPLDSDALGETNCNCSGRRHKNCNDTTAKVDGNPVNATTPVTHSVKCQLARTTLRKRIKGCGPSNEARLEYDIEVTQAFAKRYKKMSKNEANAVDVMSRILFPLTFLIFNISYWTIYLLIL